MRKKVKRKCINCGKEFYALPTEIKRGGGKYCCRKCFYEKGCGNKTHRFGRIAPNWKGGKSKGEQKKKYQKEYTEKNRDRKNYLNLRRYVRKKQTEGSHTFGEWKLLKKQYGFTCPCCGRQEPKIVLTEDHIIPLSKGGSNFIENIQPLCRSCNSRKHTKIIKYSK